MAEPPEASKRGDITFVHVRNVFIPAAVVSGGYIWTVGQGGFESTNKNLCVLWEHLPLPAYQACEFQYLLVFAWTAVILTAAVWAIVNAARLISRVQNRRNRLFAHWLFFGIFLVGTGVSLIRLIEQYRPSPGSKETGAAGVPVTIPKAAAELVQPSPFEVGPNIYSESRSVKAPDGRETNIYENTFYLIVANSSDDGKTLRKVQVEFRGYEAPFAAEIKDSTLSEIDIKHGNAAFFVIGRIVSSKNIGAFKGSVTIEESHLKSFEQRASLDQLGFNIGALGNKYRFTLGSPPYPPTGWVLIAVISAEDRKSRAVTLNIDARDQKNPVTFAKGEIENEKR
jgi:hypothetical protein